MMKLCVDESSDNYLFEMANIRGKTVKIPKRLPFSFSFTSNDSVESKDSSHGFRIKVVFNPEKINASELGTMRMFGDYDYTPGINDVDIDSQSVKKMKRFFIEYKILFAAVWEKVLPQDALQDFFKGHVSLNELVREFDFYEKYAVELNTVTNLDELRHIVKKYSLFNIWDK